MEKRESKVHVVGGGLAGCEAAWQVLLRGHSVVLHEMRPSRGTPAHASGGLAEIVCSNSLKSEAPDSAAGQLKFELAGLRSLMLQTAHEARVPAGRALAVDRERFSKLIAKRLHSHPLFSAVEQEITEIPPFEELERQGDCWIVATGPLTSPGFLPALARLCESKDLLFFYDAIAPIIDASSIDMTACFRGDRYEDTGDYLNIPLDRDQYESFVDAVMAAPKTPLREFEEPLFFESCLPIEVMIERGRETLRFGPMKPVGLTDPKTGQRPYANIQLRLENAAGTMYNMVGFQTKMTRGAQKDVFSRLPGLSKAEFLRFGSIHRNTFVQSPSVLCSDLSFRSNTRVFLAGQVSGVEGYVESAACGLLAGLSAVARLEGRRFEFPPASTIIGALAQHVTKGTSTQFQPMNANAGLLPPLPKQRGVSKIDRKKMQFELARANFTRWLNSQ